MVKPLHYRTSLPPPLQGESRVETLLQDNTPSSTSILKRGKERKSHNLKTALLPLSLFSKEVKQGEVTPTRHHFFLYLSSLPFSHAAQSSQAGTGTKVKLHVVAKMMGVNYVDLYFWQRRFNIAPEHERDEKQRGRKNRASEKRKIRETERQIGKKGVLRSYL